MKQDYEMTDWAARYEAMRRNGGEIARPITEERWDEMLGVMPPANWRHEQNEEGISFECFMVNEPHTQDLYTWCAWLEVEGKESFWEMIAPSSCKIDDIYRRVKIGQRHA